MEIGKGKYGPRHGGGSDKGTGWLGVIKADDGSIMTELTIGIDFGEGSEEIPTLIPGLTDSELAAIKKGDMPGSVVDKAAYHAWKRKQEGLSPFFD